MSVPSKAPAEEHQAAIREPRSFGRRREPATITFVRNGRTRQIAVNPLHLSIVVSVVAMFMAGYLVATGYLIFRDDLIGAAAARNARLMHEYEDRIASLRANLDRVTSRQLLDQQAIESKITELLEREEILRSRSGRIGELVDQARRNGLVRRESADNRQPPAAPEAPPNEATAVPGPQARLGGLPLRGTRDVRQPQTLVAKLATPPDLNDIVATETMFSQIAERIEEIEAGQRRVLGEIRQAAVRRSADIAGVMEKLDVKLPEPIRGRTGANGNGQTQVGGPFIPADPAASFSEHVTALDGSLKLLDRMTARLTSLPVANPVPGRKVSSAFGTRLDPFLGRAAMHSGIDFRAPSGAPARATAAGTVIDAGRNGGYGNMVEIDHGDGLTTRYAHLSRILVKTGDKVARGDRIGFVGSTGRSTGPHLHYEIRKSGRAIDPARFLKAGRELASFL